MQVILALVGIVLALWLGYMVIALGGEFIILSIEAAARGSFASSPALGWVLVGVVVGAVIGGLYGLRRVGAPASKRLAATLIAVPFGTLLMIGWVRGVPQGSGLPTAASAGAEARVAVQGNGITLRSEPSTESRVLQTLPGGSRVVPLRTTSTGDWTEVADPSIPPAFQGWIMSAYLPRGTVHQPTERQAPLDLIGVGTQPEKPSPVHARQESPPTAPVAAPVPEQCDPVKVYQPNQLTSAAELVRGTGAPFPASARNSGLSEATVTVEFVVSTEGHVVPGSVRALGSVPDPMFLRAASETLEEQFQYDPAHVGECVVASRVKHIFLFRLEGADERVKEAVKEEVKAEAKDAAAKKLKGIFKR